MTEDDIPWIHAVVNRKYSDKFDRISMEGWYRNIVLKNPMLFYPARTDNALCISMLSLVPWFPGDIECSVILFCAEDGKMWEGVRLLRASIAWTKTRKGNTWRICSETDTDLAMMAKRVGATEIWPRFILRL
jgi:hypothetical protein